jgi:adenylate kinase
MRIILLGPPGSGKGTQGSLLEKELGLKRLSIGALLRREIENKSPIGKEIEDTVKNGKNVSAEILRHVLITWFTEQKDGFIIDNFPRSHDQLDLCRQLIDEGHLKIDKVFHIVVSEETSLQRLLRRQEERVHAGNPRIDETPETIHSRYETGYIKDIPSILSYFLSLGILIEVDGEKSVSDVHKEIMEKLGRKNHDTH